MRDAIVTVRLRGQDKPRAGRDVVHPRSMRVSSTSSTSNSCPPPLPLALHLLILTSLYLRSTPPILLGGSVSFSLTERMAHQRLGVLRSRSTQSSTCWSELDGMPSQRGRHGFPSFPPRLDLKGFVCSRLGGHQCDAYPNLPRKGMKRTSSLTKSRGNRRFLKRFFDQPYHRQSNIQGLNHCLPQTDTASTLRQPSRRGLDAQRTPRRAKICQLRGSRRPEGGRAIGLESKEDREIRPQRGWAKADQTSKGGRCDEENGLPQCGSNIPTTYSPSFEGK